MKPLLLLFATLTVLTASAQSRWTIEDDGGIAWKPNRRDPHEHNIEMSGRKVSGIVYYGINGEGTFYTRKLMVLPTFRTIPVNTRSFVSATFGEQDSPRVLVDRNVQGSGNGLVVRHKGIMTITG